MNIYLAGPMRGIKNDNFPAFNAAAEVLRAKGHTVFNPAEQGNGKPVRDLFRVDTHWICTTADVVVALPGWQTSRGAVAEVALAKALELDAVEFHAFDHWMSRYWTNGQDKQAG